MKKKIISLGIVLVSLFMITGSAFASAPSFSIYSTDADGSYADVDEFGWDVVPWIRMYLPEAGWSVTGSFWKTPSETYYFAETSSTEQNRWMSGNDLTDQKGNSVSWTDIQEVGTWNVNATYLNASTGATGPASASFTVTPEPISAILFGLGGLSIAAIRRRKFNSK